MISESDGPPVAAPTNAGGAVTVHVVGELQAFFPPAVFTGCRFYVPFSAGANALGPPVDWNSRTAAAEMRSDCGSTSIPRSEGTIVGGSLPLPPRKMG